MEEKLEKLTGKTFNRGEEQKENLKNVDFLLFQKIVSNVLPINTYKTFIESNGIDPIDYGKTLVISDSLLE